MAPAASAASAGARHRVLVGQVRGPVVHELPPPVEQVGPGVGGLHLVLDDMRPRRLDDLTRMVGLLGRPVPERRTEAMGYSRDPKVLERLDQRRRRDRSPTPHREHERIAVAQRPRRVEDLQRPAAQRNPVLPFRLHPLRRQGPHVVRRVDLRPLRAPCLARPRGGQHEELERQLDGGLRGPRPHCLDGRGNVPVRQGLPVRHDVVLWAEHRQHPVAGIVVAHVQGDGPLQHRPDALAFASRARWTARCAAGGAETPRTVPPAPGGAPKLAVRARPAPCGVAASSPRLPPASSRGVRSDGVAVPELRQVARCALAHRDLQLTRQLLPDQIHVARGQPYCPPAAVSARPRPVRACQSHPAPALRRCSSPVAPS